MQPSDFLYWHNRLTDPVEGPLATALFQQQACDDLYEAVKRYVRSRFARVSDETVHDAACHALLAYLKDPAKADRYSYSDGPFGHLRTIAWRTAAKSWEAQKNYDKHLRCIAESSQDVAADESGGTSQLSDPSEAAALAEATDRLFAQALRAANDESDREVIRRVFYLHEPWSEAVTAVHPLATPHEQRRIADRLSRRVRRYLASDDESNAP